MFAWTDDYDAEDVKLKYQAMDKSELPLKMVEYFEGLFELADLIIHYWRLEHYLRSTRAVKKQSTLKKVVGKLFG